MIAEVEQIVLASGVDSYSAWYHCIAELPSRHNAGLESMLAEPVAVENRVCTEIEHRSFQNHHDAVSRFCLACPYPWWKEN